MDVIQQQIAAMADEINLLKSEVVQTKAAHATLHQSAVDRNTDIIRRFGEITDRLHNLSTDAANTTDGKGSRKKFLIEPKQVNVSEFAGAVNDGRSKFLQWSEKGEGSSDAVRRCPGGGYGESRSVDNADYR